jgi:hypothetical protein
LKIKIKEKLKKKNKTTTTATTTTKFVVSETNKKLITRLSLSMTQFLDCLPNVCGFDCADPCHCKKFNSEVKMSGNCSDGCVDNWTGDKKKCDRGDIISSLI